MLRTGERLTPSLGGRVEARALLASFIVDLVGARWGQDPLEEDSWRWLYQQARHERVVPLLAAAVRGGLPVTHEQASQLDEHLRWVLNHCLKVEAQLVWLVSELEQAGIDHRILKGVASAHLDYARPEERQFGDLDLLVHAGDIPKVLELLTRAGYARRNREFRPGFDERFAKSVTLRGPVEIDLHRTIAHGPIGFRIPVERLWSDPRSFSLGGVELRALPDAGRLVHACLHAYLDRPAPRLSTLADIALMLVAPVPDAETARVTARSWNVAAPFDAAINSVVVELWWPKELEASWHQHLDPAPFSSLLMASHRSAHTSSASRSLLSISTIPGLRQKARFLGGLLRPLAGRGPEPTTSLQSLPILDAAPPRVVEGNANGPLRRIDR